MLFFIALKQVIKGWKNVLYSGQNRRKYYNVDEKVKEGDCLKKENNKFLFDMEETKKRKMRIDKLMKGMWEN